MILLDEESYRNNFRNMTPKPEQIFIDYLSEVESTFDKWTVAAKVGKSFELLKDLLLRDKVLSSIPNSMMSFLIEQRPSNIRDMEKSGEAYYNAHKNIFAFSKGADLNYAAAVQAFKSKQYHQEE